MRDCELNILRGENVSAITNDDRRAVCICVNGGEYFARGKGRAATSQLAGSYGLELLVLENSISSCVLCFFCWAEVYTEFGGWGGPGSNGEGTFLHWRKQKFRVFSNSKIFKNCLKSMKKL